jgi:hypothetical protein
VRDGGEPQPCLDAARGDGPFERGAQVVQLALEKVEPFGLLEPVQVSLGRLGELDCPVEVGVRQVRVRELEEVLGPIQVGQSVLPEVAQARVGWELVACQLMDGPGDQHLAAVRERADAGAADDGDVPPIGLAGAGLGRMECDADANAQVARPALAFDRPLEPERAGHGVRGTREERNAGAPHAALQQCPTAPRHDRRRQFLPAA